MFQMLLPLASKMLTQKVMMSAGAKMMLNAGASALGTALDNQQIKKQNAKAAAAARARQGNFYVNLRNAAQRAGFNPLTVLRSGTAGAYQAEGNSYDTMPLLTSNSFANMLMDAEESQVRMDNMRAQERNMQHQQNMDKLNYDLRKAELELQVLQSKELQDDGLKYLYNADGSPKLNAYGQHMFISPTAAEVFPFYQGYADESGNTVTFPHEQLLDMNIGAIPAITLSLGTATKVEPTQSAPSAFRYNSNQLYKNMRGENRRDNRVFPKNFGKFGNMPPQPLTFQ